MVKEALIILLSFLIGYLIDNSWAFIVKKIPKTKDKHFEFIVRRVKIHHNFSGYILIIIGFFIYPLFLVSMGLGMIVGHKIRDNLFWFIELIEQEAKEVKKEVKEDREGIRKKHKKLKRNTKKKLKELLKA
jgi:hypothetical protein